MADTVVGKVKMKNSDDVLGGFSYKVKHGLPTSSTGGNISVLGIQQKKQPSLEDGMKNALSINQNLVVRQKPTNNGPSESKTTAAPDLGLNFKAKADGKRKHDTYERPSGQQARVTKVKTGEAVKKLVHGFNEGKNPEEGEEGVITLDPSEISKEDIANFDGDKWDKKDCVKGSFGVVYPAIIGNKGVMIKEIKRHSHTKVNPSEFVTPYSLQADGIIKIFALRCLKDKMMIAMEDAGRSLKWWLTNRENDHFRNWSREPGSLLQFTLDLVKILKYLEIQCVVHRDIKPENICVAVRNGKFVITLVDFGSTQCLNHKVFLAGHTPEYLPPGCNKVIYASKMKHPYHLDQNLFFYEKCDIWAGCMVILTVFKRGFHPIPEVNQYNEDEVIQNLQRIEVMKLIIRMPERYFEDILKKIEEPIQHVLRNVLHVSRDLRWSARQVCTHLEGDGRRAAAKYQKHSTDALLLNKQQQQSILRPSVFPTGNSQGLKFILHHLPGDQSNPAAAHPPYKIVGMSTANTTALPRKDQDTGLSDLGVRAKPFIVGMNAGMTNVKQTSGSASKPNLNNSSARIVGFGGSVTKHNVQQQNFNHWMTPRDKFSQERKPIELEFSQKNDDKPINTEITTKMGQNIPNFLLDMDNDKAVHENASSIMAANTLDAAHGVSAPSNHHQGLGADGGDQQMVIEKAQPMVIPMEVNTSGPLPNLEEMHGWDFESCIEQQKSQRKIINGRRRSSNNKH